MSVGVASLLGLWQRSLIEWPDGRRDSTSRVYWLQGLSMCIDLRQPPSPAPGGFADVRSHTELSALQCAWLAQQQGFAGVCSFDGHHYVWSRSIDFQPRATLPDAGSLHWDGAVLVETGRDLPYVEHWHRTSAATQPVAAAQLRDTDDGRAGALLRVGAVFMFARDRSQPLAEGATQGNSVHGDSLLEHVNGATTLRDAQERVNCEISFGQVLASGFRITASTLPWRIGARLAPQLGSAHLSTLEGAALAAATTRRWQIVRLEGDVQALVAPQAMHENPIVSKKELQ
jgi:hypothetical protein